MRVGVRIAIATAALVAAAPARAVFYQPPVLVPAVTASGGQTLLAWSDGAAIRTATRNLDGTFGRGFSFGEGDQSPQVATTPDGGHTMLLWQSGETLRSAALTPGSLHTETVAASEVSNYRPPLLVMDATGRATAAWVAYAAPGTPDTLLVSSHPAAGTWSVPVPLAVDVRAPAMAVDGAGDIVVAYWLPVPGSVNAGGPIPGAVWATTLPTGAAGWSAPEIISGWDPVYSSEPAVAGGGARTFVVSWSRSYVQPAVRTARLRVPSAWEPPRDVVPAGLAPPGYRYAEGWRSAVDGMGNALMVLRFPMLEDGFALAAARLPASAGEWATPTTLDLPGHRYRSNSRPAVALADDGSATVAFLQRRSDGISLRVATANGPLGAWEAQDTDVAMLSSCSYRARCPSEWDVAPVIGVGRQATTVAVQTRPGFVIAVSRPARGGPWSNPVTVQSAGPTQVYLRNAHVRKGYIRVFAGCALPPCQGVVVLRTAGRAHRVLARMAVALGWSQVESAPVLLPRWARAQLKHGGRLRTHLVLDVSTGDGSTARVQRTVLLHN
jgi:hypothetical protein